SLFLVCLLKDKYLSVQRTAASRWVSCGSLASFPAHPRTTPGSCIRRSVGSGAVYIVAISLIDRPPNPPTAPLAGGLDFVGTKHAL
ncbi:hypothetical protein, partial [Undibacterium sp. TJN19]|uniref:hypothetical protein n=1 Tax=Undibacterium sp. TJN19 TaxID=3413055 RepID=UPI003BF11D52